MPFAAPEALHLLLQAHAQNRLAHAYLISGSEQSGKRDLASKLCAHLLNCTVESALSHPDVHSIVPESKSRRLLIEQIRELEGRIQMRSSSGGKKVGLIHDADRMTLEAANAFLKTLEEPPPETHILLLSTQPGQLPDTILSRCIEVPLHRLQRPARSSAESALIDLISQYFSSKKPSLTSGLWLAQQLQALLFSTKDAITEALEAEAKEEAQRYKQMVDSKWLEKREEIYNARIEASYISERNRLFETLEAFWTDVLLLQKEQSARHLPECASHATALAKSLSTGQALVRIQSITQMRENLGRSGVNEALALEYGILEAFAPE